MLGAIVVPLVVIVADPGHLVPERAESAYCDATMVEGPRGWQFKAEPEGMALPCVPLACVPTYCETGVERSDGSLLCVDTNEVYPAGHWSIDLDPDYREEQFTVEY